MESFSFVSPLIGRPLLIQQEVTGVIGCKVYPGALLLVGHFEKHPPAPTTRFLELGSGVCGLPSLVLAGAGCSVVATDVPAITGGLASNLVLNESSATCHALTWGDAAEACALRAALVSCGGALRGHRPPCPLPTEAPRPGSGGGSVAGLIDVIIAADVVYHEPLIEPLLQALVTLTDPPPREATDASAASLATLCQCPPPSIVMTYVQRLKQAKVFFRLAKKWFDIEVIPVGSVVDYDILSWGAWGDDATEQAAIAGTAGYPCPTASSEEGTLGKRSHPQRIVHSSSADYGAYMAAQEARASARRALASSEESSEAGGVGAAGDRSSSAPPVVWHAVDSDSDPDEDKAGAYLAGFSGATACAQGGGRGAAASDDDDGGGPTPTPRKAYVYVLTRKGAATSAKQRGAAGKGAGRQGGGSAAAAAAAPAAATDLSRDGR